MTSTRHEELIARLEVSSGSRVLDLEIHIAAVKDEIWPARDGYGRITNPDSRMSDYVAAYRDVIDSDDQDFDIPHYSTSIDAALTLVPEDRDVILKIYEPGEHVAFCPFKDGSFSKTLSKGATPAIALCIASLKARTAQKCE